jgi:hypothetical protein
MCGLEFAYPATPSAEGARGPLPTIMPPPPTCVGVVAPPVPEEVEHTVTDGVMTLVTVPAPEYAVRQNLQARDVLFCLGGGLLFRGRYARVVRPTTTGEAFGM